MRADVRTRPPRQAEESQQTEDGRYKSWWYHEYAAVRQISVQPLAGEGDQVQLSQDSGPEPVCGNREPTVIH